ncbi:MAG: DNA-directed RNA polymerase subunit omega [Firmicutes bacterium]|nr:DNA-directed RNA polymerase subunit omega [Bacillota bacterium]
MLYPSINDLRDKVDSKYTLVILAAKRARDLIDGKMPLVDIGFSKPVSIATEEISEDIITYNRNQPAEEADAAEELAEEPVFSAENMDLSGIIVESTPEMVGEEIAAEPAE